MIKVFKSEWVIRNYFQQEVMPTVKHERLIVRTIEEDIFRCKICKSIKVNKKLNKSE
jgi:hypothetical protein